MTAPFSSQAHPSHPTIPSGAPQGYVTPTQLGTSPNEPPLTSGQIDSLRFQFIDLVLRQVVKAIFGFFSLGNGSAFDQLAQWAQSITGAVSNIVGDVIEILLNLIFGGGNTGFPYTFPISFTESNIIARFFENLRRFLSFDFVDPAFDLASAVVKFIEDVLKPSNLLAWLTDTGILPDELSPQAFLDLITNIFNAFDRIDPTGITGFFGDLMQGVFDIFTGILDQADTHSSKLLELEAAVFAEEGTQIVEDFVGPDVDDLANLGWTRLNFGIGSSGDIARKDGYAYWLHHGSSSDQTTFYISPAGTLDSHIQACTHLLRKKIEVSGPCAYWMALRVNQTNDPQELEGVYVRVTSNLVTCGYMIDGTATDFGSGQIEPVNYTRANNERWDFQIGDGDDDWRWIIKRNDVTLIDTSFEPPDSEGLLNSTTHVYPAFGMTADGVFIFVPFQVGPTQVEAISWSVPKVAEE